MKIAIIFFAAVLSISFVSASMYTSGLCRNVGVSVTSSLQKTAQVFDFDVKKLVNINIGMNESEFVGANFIPLEQVGFVLKKTSATQQLDAIHHKYLRNEQNSVWLPYSYSGSWDRNGFVVTSQMTRTATDKKATPLVFFEFLNDPEINNLDNGDMQEFLSSLKKNTERRQGVKVLLHKNINSQQNNVISAQDSITAMTTKNQNISTQITTWTTKKTTIITEITTVTTKITTLTQTVAEQTTTLSKTNNQIDDILSQINNLKKRIQTAENELRNWRPQDLSAATANLKVHLNLMEFPQNAPEEFRKEFTIATQNNKNIVDTAYTSCNKAEANVVACNNIANQGFDIQKKKLRRSFF